MDVVENDLKFLLDGKAISEGPIDVTQFRAEEFTPLTKRTICYIVGAIITNDEGKVLMIQEAKESCRGKWYLPCGRMEPNESIAEAGKREVEEESGFQFEPTTLLAVEVQVGTWWRFTLTGKITGGHLKTLEEKDDESLQAKWCDIDEIINGGSKDIPLRHRDFTDLLVMYKEKRHVNVLPVENSHKLMTIRTVIVYTEGESHDLFTVVGLKSKPHFPKCWMNAYCSSTYDAMESILRDIFGKSGIKFKKHGVLSLEFNGKPQYTNDGICMTLLLTISPNVKKFPVIDNENYQWHCISDQELKTAIYDKLGDDMVVLDPLISL